MRIEQIGEPIRVLAAFSGGRAKPLRFRWNGREYRIDRINAEWTDRQCTGCRLHYSVQVGEESYNLHFASSDLQWWLDQVALAG